METRIFKAKTRQQVAQEYGISRKTLSRWLIRANIKLPSGLIKPCYLRIIYKNFGAP
jgi:hypothetical protein